MGLIRRALNLDGPSFEARGGTLPAGFEGQFRMGRRTSSGELVDTQTALRTAAVAACRRVLVASVLSMPPASYSPQDGRLVKNSSERAVVRKPSARYSRRAWLAQMANSLVLDGNMLGLVTEYNTMGQPMQVEPLGKDSVRWLDNAKGDSAVVHGKVERLYPLGNLVLQQATPFLRAGNLLADSPVDLAMEGIGAALAAERFGSEFFGDGAHPSSVVTSDMKLTRPQAEGIKRAIVNSWKGREPAVLGAGLKWEPVEVNPNDSQFIDLMRFEIEQACRFFGVPPSMVYAAVSGQAVTYANIAQSDIQFLKHSLGSWVDDIEDMWSALVPGGQCVKLDPNNLLRMSPKERHELYGMRLDKGTMAVNEVRVAEDEPPFPGGDYDLPPSEKSQEVEQL